MAVSLQHTYYHTLKSMHTTCNHDVREIATKDVCLAKHVGGGGGDGDGLNVTDTIDSNHNNTLIVYLSSVLSSEH